MKAWLKGGLIGGIVGLFFSILLVTGLGNTLPFRLVGELWFVLNILSYPITALLCFLIQGRMCQGEEGMIFIITGPITGLLTGFIIGILISRIIEKIKNNRRQVN